MLKNFNNEDVNENIHNDINFINSTERKYIIFSNLSHKKFTNLCFDINKLKINSSLLLEDENFSIKLKQLMCNDNEEIIEWDKNYHSSLNNDVYSKEQKILRLICISHSIGIITSVQNNIMKHIHSLVCNIFILDDVYYKEKNNESIIHYKPTKNEINYYFDILEIIIKILSREYYNKIYSEKCYDFETKFNSYYNVINNSDYLKSIKFIKDNI
jgi:hypothetical protein